MAPRGGRVWLAAATETSRSLEAGEPHREAAADRGASGSTRAPGEHPGVSALASGDRDRDGGSRGLAEE